MKSSPIQCHVLLPVHPEYAEKLLSREKTVEFRKVAFSQAVDRIIIYATAPVKKVVGTVKLVKEKWYTLDRLWNTCHRQGCISEQAFRKYYQGREFGYALHVGEPIRLAEPIDIKAELDPKFRAPQSYAYIPKSCHLTRLLKKRGGLR